MNNITFIFLLFLATIVFLVLIGLVGLIFALQYLTQSHTQSSTEPLIKTKNLLTNTEAIFYWKLKDANADRFTIAMKVKLEELFKPPRLNKSLYSMYRNGHIDFLLLNAKTLQPLAAIELDDKSHFTLDGTLRTERKDILFRNSSIPLKRFCVADHPDAQTIRAWIDSLPQPEKTIDQTFHEPMVNSHRP